METSFLVMVVQWRHQKDATAFTEFLTRVLEPADLHYYGQVLHDEDTTKYWDQ